MAKKTKPPRGAIKKEIRQQEAKEADLNKYSPEPLFYNNEEKAFATCVYLSSIAIYIYTMYPGLPGGDSGELMATAKDFGVSHPPGYPTFTTLAAIMINVFPFGTTAWKTNLLSCLIGGLANVLLYINVKRFSGSDAAGLLTAGWCGFSRIFWMWSIQGEVFSFSNFFAALIMYAAWRFGNAEGRPGKFYEAKLGALVCGLALTNQHTSVLYIFPTSLWVLFTLWRHELASMKYLFQVGLRGLLGLTPYIQLPISSFFFNARVTWGDHRLLSDFKKHLLREDFGTFRLVSSNEKSTLMDNFMVYFNDSTRELTLAVYLLLLVTVVVVSMRGSGKQKEVLALYIAMFSTYHLVFSSLANIKNPKGIFHGVLERFWLQPNIALCTMAGSGLGMLFSLACDRVNSLRHLFLVLAVVLVGVQIQLNYDDCNENDNYFFYHYSRNLLPHVPRRSIIMTSGDFSTNTFRYHTIGEEYRTDVMVMDMQFMQAVWFYIMLMPVNWPDVSFPGVYKAGKNQKYPYYNLKTFLDENMPRFPDIYMCVNVPDAEDSIVGYYEAWPYGMCRKFVKINTPSTPDRIEFLKNIPMWDLDTTPIPNIDRYEPQTWEYTLLSSVLESFSKPSVFLWNYANQFSGDDSKLSERKRLYEKAFEMLKTNRKYIHDRIESGLIAYNTQRLMSPMEKSLGHLALILHAIETDDSKKKVYEAAVIEHWKNYKQWFTTDVIETDPMMTTIDSILDAGNLNGVRIQL